MAPLHYPGSMLRLLEFPADDPERARRFWEGVLGVPLDPRTPDEGQGWQTHAQGPALGVHPRGAGPGDRFSLPYVDVEAMDEAIDRVVGLGGEVIHRGERWSVCRDSEGTPFGLAAEAATLDTAG